MIFDKCTSICRVLILAVIVCIASYFVYSNEKELKKGKKEGFVNNAVIGQEYRTEIIKVYKDFLKRDPEEFEVLKARDLMDNPADTGRVIDSIKTSEEYSLRVQVAADKLPTQSKEASGSTKPPAAKASDTPDDVVAKMDLNKRLDMYRTILQVYERNLDRLPNMKELNYYTYRMLTDKKFNVDTLEKILQSSKEYMILNKNQKNEVNSGLEGNITDAQLKYEVRTIYDDIFHGMPSREFEDFMKYKLIEYRLDASKLRSLLLLLKVNDDDTVSVVVNGNKIDISSKNASIDVSATAGTSNSSNTNSNTTSSTSSSTTVNNTNNTSTNTNNSSSTKTGGTGSMLDEQFKPAVMEEGQVQKYLQKHPNVFNIINPSQEDMDSIMETIEDGNTCMQGCMGEGKQRKAKKCINPYNATPYKDELYEALKKEVNGSSTINRKDVRERICSAVDDRNKNMLAEYEQDRNLDTMRSVCSRNSYFLNMDDKLAYEDKMAITKATGDGASREDGMVLASNWDHNFGEEPMGTNLRDAKNTMVGSIMPRFIYKEYMS